MSAFRLPPARLTVRRERWPLAEPFAIARGTKAEAEVVVAELASGQALGRGECVPYRRYGETVAGVAEALTGLADAAAAGLSGDTLAGLLPPGAARNALDCAAWDLHAKLSGVPVWRMLGLPEPGWVATALTVVIGTPEAMAARAVRMAAAVAPARALLKVKLDADRILERVGAVRAAVPGARLIADANEAWSAAVLADVAPGLAALGVELIEQPLPAGADADLAQYAGPVPLCADESAHTGADLPGLAGRYGLVNVKLDKAGGLTEAAAMVRAARAAGLGIMVGCMVGTSLAMAPALLLAPLADYVDLDGALLLAVDRTPPLPFADGCLGPPAATLWG